MNAVVIRLMLCAITLALAACDLRLSKSDSATTAAADVASTSSVAPAPISGSAGSTSTTTTSTTTTTSSAGSMTATIGWADASGPVRGYRVAISRNGEPAKAEFEVSASTATITANPGDTVVVRVAALDAERNRGPYSEPSDPIVFGDDGKVYVQRSSGSLDLALGGATTSSVSGDSTSTRNAASVLLEDKTRFDFDGDRASDMLFEAPAPDHALRIARFAGGALLTDLDFDRSTNDWLVVAADDFDGDGRADILWENADGTLAYSAASRLYEIAPKVPLAAMGTLGGDELVVATGDFDADGRGDLLVRDERSASHTLWLTDADGVGRRVGLDVPVAAGSLAVRTGDFDGDGRSDIVWRGADGRTSVSFMDAGAAVAMLEIASGFGHEILASGDFDGDRSDDLVHSDPATGAVGVLLMSARRQPVAWTTAVDPGLGWGVAAAGDYDADGRADLLWESQAGLALGLHPAGSAAATFVPIDAGGNWNVVADQ